MVNWHSTSATTTMVAACLALAYATSAHADCLTKLEAKHRWPRAHIYWHGTQHCWDNTVPGIEVNESPVAATSRQAKVVEPVGSGSPVTGTIETAFPSLIINRRELLPVYPGYKVIPWFDAHPMINWPPVMDIDAPSFVQWQRRID